MIMTNNNPFGEIIESSLTHWTAQSWQWDTFPHFGSIVAVQQGYRTLIGIVHKVETGSSDPSRQPYAYQKTEAELLAEQPQIFEFLKTTFTSLTLGYVDAGKPYYMIAPQPPKIHAFVQLVSTDLFQLFFCKPYYLHILFGNAHLVENIDELLLGLLAQHTQHDRVSNQKIRHFMEQYSLLTGNDYRRTKLFLQRATQFIGE